MRHTYLLRLTAPRGNDTAVITFTYYYGDKNNSCIYNAENVAARYGNRTSYARSMGWICKSDFGR